MTYTDFSGIWKVNQEKTDKHADAYFSLQGVGWLKRKAMLSTISGAIQAYSHDADTWKAEFRTTFRTIEFNHRFGKAVESQNFVFGPIKELMTWKDTNKTILSHEIKHSAGTETSDRYMQGKYMVVESHFVTTTGKKMMFKRYFEKVKN